MFSYGPKLNTILVIIIIANTYKALTMSRAVLSTSHILTHLHSKYVGRKKNPMMHFKTKQKWLLNYPTPTHSLRALFQAYTHTHTHTGEHYSTVNKKYDIFRSMDGN